ncbi:MAG: hypothetical protein ABIF40_02595 [archaeon]
MVKWPFLQKLDKKHLLIPTIIVVLEGVIALSSLPAGYKANNNPYFEKHVWAWQRSAYVIEEGPRWAAYQTEINQVPFKDIENAAQYSYKELQTLQTTDNMNEISEIQGVITLNEDKLKFYPFECSNSKHAENLNGLYDSPEQAKDYLKKNQKEINKILNIDGNIQLKENLSLEEVQKIINVYVYLSDSASSCTTNDYVQFYANNNLDGKVIGSFHTHNDGSSPSDFDYDKSLKRREIVISFTQEGNSFTLYDLVKGDEQNITVLPFKE